MRNEPAIIATAVLGVILAILGLVGVEVSAANQENLLTVLAFVIPLVGSLGIGAWIRSKVSPVDGESRAYPQDPSRVGEASPANDPSREQAPGRYGDPEEEAPRQDFDNGPDKPGLPR